MVCCTVKEYIIAGMIASHSLQSNLAIPWLELIGFESLSVFHRYVILTSEFS